MKSKPQTPAQVASFRRATEGHAAYAGVQSPTFRCMVCRQHKTAKGRKQMAKGSTRFGYKCADCAAKEAAK